MTDILYQLYESEEKFISDFELEALNKTYISIRSDCHAEAGKCLSDIYYYHKLHLYPNLKLCENDLHKIIEIFNSPADGNIFCLYIAFALYIPQAKLLYRKYPMKRLMEYLNIFDAIINLLQLYPEIQNSEANMFDECCTIRQKLCDTLIMMLNALQYNSVEFNEQKSEVNIKFKYIFI